MAVKACAGPMTPSKVECHDFFLTEFVKSSSHCGCQRIVPTGTSWHTCIFFLFVILAVLYIFWIIKKNTDKGDNTTKYIEFIWLVN